MSIVEGDIDLTQNLDFYRKKPKKLLPANIELLGKNDKPEPTINPSLDDTFYITNISGNSITVRYSSGISTWSLDRDTDSYNHINIDEYNYYDNDYNSTLYITTNNNTYSYNTTFSTTTTISSRNNSINVSTYELDDEYGELNSWKCKMKYIKNKSNTPLKKLFSKWQSKKHFEEKESLSIYKCHCGEKFLAIRGFDGVCKDCLKNQELKDKERSFASRAAFTNIFKFNKREPINYDYIGDEVPWNNSEKYFGIKSRSRGYGGYIRSIRNKSENRYGIPWFQELYSRIYDDYIDELKNGEKDYSSYLTNMGWIGIHRQRDEEFIDSINSQNITLINNSNDLSSGIIRSSNDNLLYWNTDNIETMIYNA